MSNLTLSDNSEFSLYLVRVNDSGEISAGHQRSVEHIPSLLDSFNSIASEDSVQLRESILGPDNESAQMTAWGQLQKVQSMHIASVNTWEISSSSLHKVVFISIYNEWSLSHDISTVSHLSMSNSDFS